MRAGTIRRFGPPGVIEISDVAQPEPAAGRCW